MPKTQKAVRLMKRVKLHGQWRWCRLAADSKGQPKRDVVLVKGREQKHPETGLFQPEYVNIFGVPFTFLPHEGSADAPPPPPATGKTRIEPVPERRSPHELTWPNVIRLDHESRP